MARLASVGDRNDAFSSEILNWLGRRFGEPAMSPSSPMPLAASP